MTNRREQDAREAIIDSLSYTTQLRMNNRNQTPRNNAYTRSSNANQVESSFTSQGTLDALGRTITFDKRGLSSSEKG